MKLLKKYWIVCLLLGVAVIIQADVHRPVQVSQRVIKDGAFWYLKDQQPAFVDVKLIEQMICITKIPTPLIMYVDDASSSGSICMTVIVEDTGIRHELPCIKLWKEKWTDLPNDQKIFILLHEAAHYLLGHLKTESTQTFGAKMRDACGDDAFHLIAICSWYLIFYTCFSYAFPGKRKKSHTGWLGLAGLSSFFYLLCRQEYVISQQHEKDADLLAVDYTGNAVGGVRSYCTG